MKMLVIVYRSYYVMRTPFGFWFINYVAIHHILIATHQISLNKRVTREKEGVKNLEFKTINISRLCYF